MGFNSGFKGLRTHVLQIYIQKHNAQAQGPKLQRASNDSNMA